jgi:uncharacterized membrane protein HdeD (DUF308 family)
MSIEFTRVEVSEYSLKDADRVGAGRWWGGFLAAGIAAVLLGFVVLVWRTETLYALIYFAGAAFVAMGVIRVMGAVVGPVDRALSLIGGIVFLAIGITIFVWPHITLFVVALLIGLAFTAWGVLELVKAFANTNARHWWVSLIAGIASLIVAIWTVRHPGNALNVLMIVLGIWILLWGALEIAAALLVRRVDRGVGDALATP